MALSRSLFYRAIFPVASSLVLATTVHPEDVDTASYIEIKHPAFARALGSSASSAYFGRRAPLVVFFTSRYKNLVNLFCLLYDLVLWVVFDAGIIFLSDEDVDVKRLLTRWLNTQPKELQAGLSCWVDDMFFR